MELNSSNTSDAFMSKFYFIVTYQVHQSSTPCDLGSYQFQLGSLTSKDTDKEISGCLRLVAGIIHFVKDSENIMYLFSCLYLKFLAKTEPLIRITFHIN